LVRSGLDDAVSDAGRTFDLAPEDVLRAQLYQLLALALCAPPSADVLKAFADISGDESRLGQSLTLCAEAARNTGPEAENDAYHDLFIGIGSGILVPFGSYYLTGFLNEKPLATLRQDMAVLGVEQDPDVKEPEDHISSVMEMMAGLIEGRFGVPATLKEQETFFEAHVGSWAPHFFKDLSKTTPSAFYAAVGVLGTSFIEIEAKGFEYA
jgi:TorA maturation chaperone TorD